MEITWKYVKPLKDPKAVKSFLAKYKIDLPTSLVDIMEKYNGGRPSDKVVVTDTKREYVFKSMLSYNSDDKETIYKIYPDLFKETDWFPFASDAAGNFICYDVKKKKCVLYNHETDKGEAITEMALKV